MSAPAQRLLRLGLGVLEVLVGTVGDQTTNEEDGVEADAEAAGGARAGGGGGRGRVGGGRGGVAGLQVRLLEAMCELIGSGGDRTRRLRLPTKRPSRISRASSEWPTSSKASVAS